MAIAGDDPLKAEALEKDTLINYWAILNKKLLDARRLEAQKQADKKKARGRRNH